MAIEMNTIRPLWDTMPIVPEKESASGNPNASMFSQIFQGAIDTVKETDAEKNQVQYLLATGQLDNPALSAIASSKAQMSFELLSQLRNKALESYNELMRLSL